jgi:hypothetical protein
VLSTYQLTCVAFVRSTGGRIRVLLTIDRDGLPLFDGDPALLVEHRPWTEPGSLTVDGPDSLDPVAYEVVHRSVAPELASIVDEAHDRTGAFDASRLLGRSVGFEAPVDAFGA